MPDNNHIPGGVFLSYAREDTDAARRMAEALRAFGVDAWFDQGELRGGDAWDAKIRTQIKTCALFMPIVSRRTEERSEGYFRREWKLAVDRTHDMGAGRAFIVPVVIDDTTETAADVPEEFRRYQWVRLFQGEPTPEFVTQIKRLLEVPRKPALPVAPPPPPLTTLPPFKQPPQATPAVPTRKSGLPGWVWGAVVIVVVGAVAAYFGMPPKPPEPLGVERSTLSVERSAAPAQPVASAKSIAVLPFANLSTDKENEFFADGVQDDVITNLAKIRDLTVISRTSTLAYRDSASRNLKKIAADLNVATVLEGSVRRVGNKVHMNAQLIDARTDAHLWADSFDGDTGDIFALQASLAQKIAAALKATLNPAERALIERRPTENQEAYECYSRARILYERINPFSLRSEYEPIVALLEQAVAKDPGFALAFAHLSGVHGQMFWFGNVDATAGRRQRAQSALETAVRLAPDAPETHMARGTYLYTCENNWRGALAEYALAEPNLPNDAYLQYRIGVAYRRLAEWPEAVTRFERSVALNPHDLSSVSTLVDSTRSLHRFEQTRTLALRFQATFPDDWRLRSLFLWAQFALDGDRAACARGWMAPKPGIDDPAQLQFKYEGEMILGDLAAAEKTLADPRLITLTTVSGTIVEPVALHRALVACARGQHEAAAKFAREAVEFCRSRTWTARQQPHILLTIAEAEAYGGDAAAAVRDGQAASEQMRAMDPFTANDSEFGLGCIYAALGRDDEALASLRKTMGNPGVTSPNQVRIHPLWSRLKDDPRFEEILKSTKPL